MTIIANSKLFYTHAWETYLIGGFIIFLIGFFLGWLLWRRARGQAQQVEEMNRTLRERQSVLSSNNRKLAALVDVLPKTPSA